MHSYDTPKRITQENSSRHLERASKNPQDYLDVFKMKSKLLSSSRRILRPLQSAINYYRENPNHPQLRMQLANLNNLENTVTPPLGYEIRTYKKGDEPSWIRIIKASFGKNLTETPETILNDILSNPEFDPESFFFATYNNEPVGTVCALTRPVGSSTVGFIHMTAVTPKHQGKRLGRALTLAALHFLKKKGIGSVILDTDDFRLKAIQTYLGLGFKPVYLNRNHKQRWTIILKKLSLPQNP